jgi:hypothetical protein
MFQFQHSTLASRNICDSAKIYDCFDTRSLPGKDNYCLLEVRAFGTLLPGGGLKNCG